MSSKVVWLIAVVAALVAGDNKALIAQTSGPQPDVVVTDQSPPAASAIPQRTIPPAGQSSGGSGAGPRLSPSTPSQFAANRPTQRLPQVNLNIRLARVPKMMGDFFGPPSNQLCQNIDINGNGDFQQFCFAVPDPSSLTGRLRVQDNNSAIPQDRVFFDYSFFHNSQLLPSGPDASRYTPGFEKDVC